MLNSQMERVYKTFVPGSQKFDPEKALRWGDNHFPVCCFLNSNKYSLDKYGTWGQILALGQAAALPATSGDAFDELRDFAGNVNDWLFGFLSYDLKNQLEDLKSSNHDGLDFPLIHFFRPVIIIFPEPDFIRIGCLPGFGRFSDPDYVYKNILQTSLTQGVSHAVKPVGRVSRERYLQQVDAIKNHIQLGDIYEMNYCVEFFNENAVIDPLSTYRKLNTLSPTPFSAYYKLDEKFLMCASPERFIKKQDDLLICQPIKGTAPRGKNPEDDLLLKNQLYNDVKERSENVMIVDLVRNDLSRVAARGSVKVSELFGIYSFSTVHQMISTVEARLGRDRCFSDALKYSFPMGSMTGAPKVRAMQLIEHYEDTRRGLFSGAVGYINPNKDFDFNVVIRSILYNKENKYLGFMAGSAITAGSVSLKEYEECLHKAMTMEKALR